MRRAESARLCRRRSREMVGTMRSEGAGRERARISVCVEADH